MQTFNAKDWLTTKQAREYLHVSYTTLTQYLQGTTRKINGKKYIYPAKLHRGIDWIKNINGYIFINKQSLKRLKNAKS